jgi:hypothetical protein
MLQDRAAAGRFLHSRPFGRKDNLGGKLVRDSKALRSEGGELAARKKKNNNPGAVKVQLSARDCSPFFGGRSGAFSGSPLLLILASQRPLPLLDGAYPACKHAVGLKH